MSVAFRRVCHVFLWVQSDVTFLWLLRLQLAAGRWALRSAVKVVISPRGVIMENPEEPWFSEANLNLNLCL